MTLHRVLALATLILASCGQPTTPAPSGTTPPAPKERKLVLGCYTTPREVYGEAIIPAFKEFWQKKTGETVTFEESYLGSGAQARQIVGGFEADVSCLSLEVDVKQLVDAQLITHDWKAGPTKGMVSRSLVVLGVRPGNPKNLREWDDIAKPGIDVLTPNVKTSGGAMWNVAAIYGAATRGKTTVTPDDAGAGKILGGILKNVRTMDKGARESMITFESGLGDVAITYENEVLASKRANKAMDYAIPRSTLLIENPIAVVDVYAKQHGNEELARAFVDFTLTPESQRIFARYGYRPVLDELNPEFTSIFPPVEDLFTIRDIGDWPAVVQKLFSNGGLYDQVYTSK